MTSNSSSPGSQRTKAIVLVLVILFFDQLLKFWIKTHMTLGDQIPVFRDWFILHFTENEGMAFGMKFGGPSGKLFLSMFRILAAILIGWYLIFLTRKKAKTTLVLCVALVFAGAVGNILDSIFYGVIFSESTYTRVAELFPADGGYAGFLQGKVVDMLYFPVIDITLPSWLPFWANESFVFFRPIFNISDSSISIGVIILLLFQQKLFQKTEEKLTGAEGETTETQAEDSNNNASPDNPAV